MATLEENINQAISDFDAIKAAIEEKGVIVAHGTDTSEYAAKISEVYEKGVAVNSNVCVCKSYENCGLNAVFGNFTENSYTSACTLTLDSLGNFVIDIPYGTVSELVAQHSDILSLSISCEEARTDFGFSVGEKISGTGVFQYFSATDDDIIISPVMSACSVSATASSKINISVALSYFGDENRPKIEIPYGAKAQIFGKIYKN